ncbi:membrane-bound O-acyltransferase family protein [Adhaeribacter arboris]|uniref:Membrane-bound O-acyltransferase family protein n=1 Tax=Adhaeribacter arboris TaxID=2072846 RepID=A0A2T2YDN9_9BACT|nr:MBOAT family O-acyltransferase [Adhaeribacter arboris]PSR53578.1 membrane-bound O-acyltransferase family protein [Adhaeribacter arboris]
MLFNSFEFLLFFPVVTILYFLLPHRFRWFLLLAASCFFYMFFKPIYILILFFTIVIDYYAGILIENSETKKKKKFYLLWSLVANIGVLAIFKYYNFFNDNITSLSEALGYQNHIPYLTILLPIGLSFHTFQAMSYTIEVYRGHQKAERHFGIYALYVMFYPQLVAGPIERPQNVLHQFHEKHYFDYDRVTSGLKLMAWGLFKKVVIADRLAIMVNEVYNNPTHYEGIPLILATVFFAIQIYCDFSGYSDIAIGSAQVMGFTLMRNFNRPYFSKNIKEFWGRWHISLSTWFRDYLYIPLGGNRVPKWRWYYNIFIVFLVSGFWHGASWTFIIWGSLHGFYQVFGQITGKSRDRIVDAIGLKKLPGLYKIIQIGTTFVLVCLAWVFFRANSLSDAWYITTHMFTGFSQSLDLIVHNGFVRQRYLFLDQTKEIFLLSFVVISILILIELFQRNRSLRLEVKKYPFPMRLVFYNIIILSILLLGSFSEAEFIYFQF